MASQPFFPTTLSPSEDFPFNVFLGQIADEIRIPEDFDKLKFYCRGQYGIGKRALEEMKSPLDLFTNLMERELLNRDNILTLQSMLWHLPRRDLQKKCVEFCETFENTLHFKVPKDEPENGYKYLKVHVQGKTLDNFKRDDLERLRATVASQLLFIPPQFVFVNGLEVSNSLIITFLIPKECDVKASPKSLESLSKVSVDVIFIDGKPVYTSADKDQTEEHLTVTESETGKLLSRYHEKERQVERLESKVSSCRRLLKEKLEELKKEREMREVKTSLIAQILVQICQLQLDDLIFKLTVKKYLENDIARPFWSLQRLSAATLFKVALRKVKDLKYDTDVISNLLDAQALLLQWQRHSDLDLQNANLQLQISQLRSRLFFTEYERNKLAYYYGMGEKDKVMTQREEYFNFIFSQCLALPLPVSVTFTGTGQVSQEVLKDFLARLGRDLRKSDVKKLLKSMTISDKDRPTLEHSATALLEYILAEENKKHGPVELRGFFKNVFAPLNRPDLISKVDEHMLAAYNAHADPRQKGKGGKTDGKEAGKERQRSETKDSKPDRKEAGKERQRHGSAEDTTQKEMLALMKSFDERLSRMEKMQTDSLSGFAGFPFSKNQPWTEKASYLSNLMRQTNVGKNP